MREELSEKVETVFDEQYMWPLGAALLLLVLEGVLPEAPRRRAPSPESAKATAPARKKRKRRGLGDDEPRRSKRGARDREATRA